MKARVVVGLVIGVLAIGASILIPPTGVGSSDLRIILIAGGATLLVGVGIGALISWPILRSLAYFRANRPDSFSWIGQRGPHFAKALAKVSLVNPVSIPTYMIVLSNSEGLEIWRTLPREPIAKIPRERIGAVDVEAGYPRALLILDVEAADGVPVRLDMVPASDRSGVFPANPAELQQIRDRVVRSIAPSGVGQ